MRQINEIEKRCVFGGDGDSNDAGTAEACEWISDTAGAIAAGTVAVGVAMTGPQNAMYVPAISTLAGEYTELMASLQCEMYSWLYVEISESVSGL